MLLEALNHITNLAQQAKAATNAAHFPNLDNLPESQVAKVTADGKLDFVTIGPPDRNHKIRFVSDIVPFLDHATQTLNGYPSVWISDNYVQILINDQPDKWRSDNAVLQLNKSPQFQTLETWETEPQAFDHRAFLKMLRRTFSANIDNFSALLRDLQNVRFENGTAINSTATSNRASIGKEISALVNATAAELPETIVLTVDTYDDPTLNTKSVIPCLLDVEPETGRFRLIPLTGTCAAAINQALARIRAKIEDDSPIEAPVFYGTP